HVGVEDVPPPVAIFGEKPFVEGDGLLGGVDASLVQLLISLHSFAFRYTFCLVHAIPHIAENADYIDEAAGGNLGIRERAAAIYLVPYNPAGTVKEREIVDPPDNLLF